MKFLFALIKYDYLQRTRSYTFLITLCASLAIAYTFVPAPDANYSTMRIGDYIGEYNSAWFGYVTAIMTSVFLSLVGFYLVSSSIKSDGITKVGQIVATTGISNFKYLLIKSLTNFMVLLTLMSIIFLMSIALFLLYNDGFDLKLISFIKPYLVIALPSLFFISILAVVFEVIFRKYTVLQNVLFFFCFASLLVFRPKTEVQYGLDVFGSKIITDHLEETVKEIKSLDDATGLTIGYVLGTQNASKKFTFTGFDFPSSFLFSRLLLIGVSIALIWVVALFFHRFDYKSIANVKGTKKITGQLNPLKDLNISSLPQIATNYSIAPMIKMELLMLFRKGKRWLWIVNFIGMLLLVMLPLKVSHQIVLPILWFLQVHRLSDLTIKENLHNMHYFVFSSQAPLKRLLGSQLISAIVLILIVASPLFVRYAFMGEIAQVLAIVIGGLFLVLLSAIMGLISKGKKLFEVVFFLVTYANINTIPFVDYFGGINASTKTSIILGILIFLISLATLMLRKRQLVQL